MTVNCPARTALSTHFPSICLPSEKARNPARGRSEGADMKRIKLALALGLGMVVSACSSFEGPTRNAPMQAPQLGAVVPQDDPRDYRLEAVRFDAPADLSVSEANSFYPLADIVWR